MSARASFFASAVLAALPFIASLFGLYRLVASSSKSSVVTPVAGVCQLAYEQTMDRAGHIAIAILLTVLIVFTARAVFILWQGWRKTASVGKAMSIAVSGASQVIDSLQEQSPRGSRIEVVYGESPFAMTLGYFRHRIALSSRLVEMLDEDELEAVIRHEFVHADRRDPLRVLLAEFFRAGLPFIPALLYLLEQFGLRKEIEADAAVVRSMGSPAPLASALSKVLAEMDETPSLAGAGLTPTEARIDALLGVPPAKRSTLKTMVVVAISSLSLSFMSLALFVLFSSPRVITQHVCLPGNL